MLSHLAKPILIMALAVAASGCGASVRHDSIHYVGGHQAIQGKEADPHKLGLVAVEYVWRGDPQVVGASLYPARHGFSLVGRLRAQSFTAFRRSRVVRVEVVDNAHRLLWSGTGKMKRDQGTLMRRSRTGTFDVAVPSISGTNHLHVGVVAEREAADLLPGICLQNSS